MEEGNKTWDQPQEQQSQSSADAMEIEDVMNLQQNHSMDDEENDSKRDSSQSLGDIATETEVLLKRISAEQNKLSYNDRNLINEEIHGVACNAKEESPEMLQYSLSKLSSELENLILEDWRNNATTSTSALSASFLLCRRDYGEGTYVNTASFRLRFLRAENFDVRKAAIRLMKFLNLVLELFGAYALHRPIKVTDFKRNELKALQSGWIQVLPFRDRSGRRLFIWTGQLGMQYEPHLRAKITLYLFLVGTRDVETQQKGVVSTVFPVKFQQPAPSDAIDTIKDGKAHQLTLMYCNKQLEALPVKICAIHYCILLDETRRPNLIQKPCFDMTSKIMSSFIPRIKLHVGKKPEVRSALSSYGFPVSLIPLTQSGAVKTAEFKKWLKLQRRIEGLATGQENIPYIDCPRSNDVVFRPGSSMTVNPGNIMFRSLVESKVQEVVSNIESAMKMPQKPKEDIATEIMDEISQHQDTRFLWWDNENDCWIEFDDLKLVRSKIAVTYRDLKLKILKSRQSNPQPANIG